jgi:leucyl aminopeptidase
MHLSTCLAALAVTSSVLATDGFDGVNAIKAPGQELRLIKTSEADPGRWVTEAEKLSKYVAKQRYFIDITDIKVCTLSSSRFSFKPFFSLRLSPSRYVIVW